jgi:hypothetical protein
MIGQIGKLDSCCFGAFAFVFQKATKLERKNKCILGDTLLVLSIVWNESVCFVESDVVVFVAVDDDDDDVVATMELFYKYYSKYVNSISVTSLIRSCWNSCYKKNELVNNCTSDHDKKCYLLRVWFGVGEIFELVVVVSPITCVWACLTSLESNNVDNKYNTNWLDDDGVVVVGVGCCGDNVGVGCGVITWPGVGRIVVVVVVVLVVVVVVLAVVVAAVVVVVGAIVFGVGAHCRRSDALKHAERQ